MSYDNNNIFLRKFFEEKSACKVYEDDFVLSFHDINPQKKIHVLVIPKENTLTWMILLKRQVQR